jgi:lycopene cyclase domain-containing protein
MTYFGFLFRYVLIPILALGAVAVWDERHSKELPGFQKKHFWRILLIHVFLALVYTTPWDNYLVATGVWSYHPQLVTGIVFGWVPIEEYTFFVVETILSGLWWLMVVRRIPLSDDFRPNKQFTIIATTVLVVVWLIFTGLFFAGGKPANYLSITLFWALPAILPQFLFGADILWHYRQLIFWAVFPPGLYLSLTDIVALRAGTWSISPAHTSGVLFFGILPLEEVVFFFITNMLIAFGLTLMLSRFSQQRMAAWRANGFTGLP